MTTLARANMLMAAVVALLGTAHGEEAKPCSGASCVEAADKYFIDEVWAKIGEKTCLTCHKIGGDAEDTSFILRDPRRSQGDAQLADLRHNRNAFTQMAQRKEGNDFRLLVKVTGGLDHGGGVVVKPDSAGFRILTDFVQRASITAKSKSPAVAVQSANTTPFFDGVAMLDDRRLLRRVTLSLAGRLPSDAETATVAEQGLKAMPALLDELMKEDAFYTRLREGFNDIFLTVGFIGNAETSLPYNNFRKTRQWTLKHDLDHIADEAERRKARYKLDDDYRSAILGEPMKLIEYIVRNDRPFSEIITADYIMVSAYSARGYGVYDQLRDQFKNPDDPFEYVPVKLAALTSDNKFFKQESATGFYPHAGILSTFQYLKRYPTTETNRNRLRARMYFQHFLGIDLLELAARVDDAAAITAKFEVPTMQASECVICHKAMDPVAGLFQDYYDLEGTFGPRKDGWFKDMFGPGFEGEDLPSEDRWRALQWLGERTVKDPRFAVAMVEHVYYILTGRKVLLPPKDLEDPLYDAKQRAYREQRRAVETIAARFSENNFNLKSAFQDWVVSDFYRVDGLEAAASNPARRAEMDDLGLSRMLAPEQVERKVNAVFGQSWGKMVASTKMLYGGIDSKEVTERATDPSGAMGAVQRVMANDIGRNFVPRDFKLPAAERVIFPGIEPGVVPGASSEGDAAIRQAMVRLHQRVLGRHDAADSAEIDRTWGLFAGIIEEAQQRKKDGIKETGPKSNFSSATDPNYTIRGWSAVVTYLLRRPEFLYE